MVKQNQVPKNSYDMEALFKLYFKYNGNVTQMLADEQCSIKHYSQLYTYCQKEGFAERYANVMNDAKERTNQELAAQLVITKAEIAAIAKAVFSRFAYRVNQVRLDKKGQPVLGPDGKPIPAFLPNSKDVEVMYKIYKTEMGEASDIIQHEFSESVKESTAKARWRAAENAQIKADAERNANNQPG